MKLFPATSQPYLTAVLLGIALAFIVIGGVSFYIEATAIQRENEIGLAALIAKSRETLALSFDTIPPTVVIESPRDGAILQPGSIVTIKVNVTDNDAVDRVLFSMNGQKIALDEVPPYGFETKVPRDPERSHEILVVASDRAGNQAHARVRFSTSR